MEPNSDFKEFLADICSHLKSDLQSFDYQNTLKNHTELSNDEKKSRHLLERCEQLINSLKLNANNTNRCCNCNKFLTKTITNCNGLNNISGSGNLEIRKQPSEQNQEQHPVLEEEEDASYLDMTANRKTKPSTDYVDFIDDKQQGSSVVVSLESISLLNSDKFKNINNKKKTRASSTIIEFLDSDSDKEIYDICNVTATTSTFTKPKNFHRQSSSTSISNKNTNHHKRAKSLEENEPILNCPYLGLPASHLPIHKSPKYGQLIRIEKRLFFDQTKKCYCGILNDWLLCYNIDNSNTIVTIPTNVHTTNSSTSTNSSSSNNSTTISNNNHSNSNSSSSNNNNNNSSNSSNNINSSNNSNICTSAQMRPILCIQLSGTEIEHYGEGKRRDLCFQIHNPDTGKKFIFQSTGDIDTKEWIHAIEAAIRGDFNLLQTNQQQQQQQQSNYSTNTNSKTSKILPQSAIAINFNNNLRKLPTPPKTYVKKPTQNGTNEITNFHQTEDIYEEPCALYQIDNQSDDKQLIENVISDEISPPIIPTKSGKSKIMATDDSGITTIIDYDIPRIFKNESILKTDSKDIHNISIVLDDRDSSQRELNKHKTEFQTKIKDVQNKLTNQFSKGSVTTTPKSSSYNNAGIILKKSPTTSGKTYTKPPILNKTTTNNMKKNCKLTDSNNRPSSASISSHSSSSFSNTTPVKNWFLNRLNKAASTSSHGCTTSPSLTTANSNIMKTKHHRKKSHDRDDVSSDGELLDSETRKNSDDNHHHHHHHDNQNPNNSTQSAKGSKVNMIINQLEANGHLPIFSRNLDRFSNVFVFGGAGNTGFSGSNKDDCNYEPIVASDS